MASRICFILTCLIVFAGCYTQLRAPRVHREQRAKSLVKPSVDSVQRFEYYYYNYCNPSEWRPLPFHGSYNPYRPYRPYRRYPVWNRHRLIREYSCWASVHDPWWRGWSPRVLVPHIVYAPAVRPQIEREQVNPRPRIRYTGVRDAPASASTIRSGSTTTESTPTAQPENSRNTKTESTQPTGNSRSTKTQSAEKSEKKEEKSETREEKRSKQRRRGGMR